MSAFWWWCLCCCWTDFMFLQIWCFIWTDKHCSERVKKWLAKKLDTFQKGQQRFCKDIVSSKTWDLARQNRILVRHRPMTNCYLQPCIIKSNFTFCGRFKLCFYFNVVGIIVGDNHQPDGCSVSLKIHMKSFKKATCSPLLCSCVLYLTTLLRMRHTKLNVLRYMYVIHTKKFIQFLFLSVLDTFLLLLLLRKSFNDHKYPVH